MAEFYGKDIEEESPTHNEPRSSSKQDKEDKIREPNNKLEDLQWSRNTKESKPNRKRPPRRRAVNRLLTNQRRRSPDNEDFEDLSNDGKYSRRREGLDRNLDPRHGRQNLRSQPKQPDYKSDDDWDDQNTTESDSDRRSPSPARYSNGKTYRSKPRSPSPARYSTGKTYRSEPTAEPRHTMPLPTRPGFPSTSRPVTPGQFTPRTLFDPRHDYYADLQLLPDATISDIVNSFQRLGKQQFSLRHSFNLSI